MSKKSKYPLHIITTTGSVEPENTNYWIDLYLKNLKQNKYNLTKRRLYFGQIKVLTDALIKELEGTYDF